MGRYRERWRRSGRRGTVDRSGIWWLWIKSWGRTIDTPYTETEVLLLRARCHQRTGGRTHNICWHNFSLVTKLILLSWRNVQCYSYVFFILCLLTCLLASIRGHGPDMHHYPNAMNHPGHAHTYSGPPPSVLAAQMAAGHAPRGNDQDNRGRAMAYQGGTLGRGHHHQVPLPPPPTEAMNGGSMSLPPVDYR